MNRIQEKYDPTKPVCDSQSDFNVAYQNASNYVEQEQVNRNWPALLLYAFVWMIFLFWAIVLAMKSPEQTRVEHLVFAMVFSPFYVIAHYTSHFVEKKKSQSSQSSSD